MPSKQLDRHFTRPPSKAAPMSAIHVFARWSPPALLHREVKGSHRDSETSQVTNYLGGGTRLSFVEAMVHTALE